jgi:cytochrome b561
MALGSTPTAWGAMAKTFHWVVAALVIYSTGYGWWMTHVAERAGRTALYQSHSSIGYDLLLLLVLRLAWRLIDRAPALPDNLQRWERVTARASHVLLYLLMLAVSIGGWLLLGTFSRTIEGTLFGIIAVPPPVLDRSLHGVLEEGHEFLAYALLALVAVHVAAALRHHYIKKNDVLRRMGWGGPSGAA